LLYTADVLLIAARHGVGAHSYADDAQLYIHTTADNCETVFPSLVSCIEDIGLWMSSNRLKLNVEKTQFTCAGTQLPQRVKTATRESSDMISEFKFLV